MNKKVGMLIQPSNLWGPPHSIVVIGNLLRPQMAAALNRAAEFSWNNKVKKLREIYIQVMEEWANESIARP